MKKIFKEEESIEILKVLSFINNMEKYQMSIQQFQREKNGRKNFD